MKRTICYTVSPEEDQKPVRDILRKTLGLSATLVKRMKRSPEGILLDGKPVTVAVPAPAGSLLTLCIEEEQDFSERIVPTPGPLSIVYEDDDLLVLDKDAGRAVHPSPGHYEDSLANIVLWHYAEQGLSFTFRPVNRLDRYTSGLMAVAKHSHAHALLNRQLQEGGLRREYRAIIEGEIAPASGTIDLPIKRKEGSVLLREVSPQGASAVTHYATEQVAGDYCLLRLRLETGRTHQIRVHLSHLGHPLLGDFLYGTEQPELIARTALHSATLSFLQPLTQQPLSFSCPLPPDMARFFPK